MTIYGYARVSTDGQSLASQDAQTVFQYHHHQLSHSAQITNFRLQFREGIPPGVAVAAANDFEVGHDTTADVVSFSSTLDT